MRTLEVAHGEGFQVERGSGRVQGRAEESHRRAKGRRGSGARESGACPLCGGFGERACRRRKRGRDQLRNPGGESDMVLAGFVQGISPAICEQIGELAHPEVHILLFLQ